MLRISVDELRPQAMDDKSKMSGLALGVRGMTVTELRRPGKRQNVIIKYTRLSGLVLPLAMVARKSQQRRSVHHRQQQEQKQSQCGLLHAWTAAFPKK